MTHWPNTGFGFCHLGWLHQQCVSVALAFCLDAVNLSIRSIYVRTYVFFTSLRTVIFNRVWWLQASHDLPVYLAAVRKLSVDFSLEILEKIAENKRGDTEEEK